MANEKNLKPWKKGQSGNPKGKPPIPKELKELKKLNAVLFAEIVTRYLKMPMPAVEHYVGDPDTPTLEKLIGSVIIAAFKNGDFTRFNFLLDRTIGKVTEKMEVKLPKPTVVKLIGEDAALVLGHAQDTEDENEEI